MSLLLLCLMHFVLHAQPTEQFDLQVWIERPLSDGHPTRALRLSSNSEGCMAWIGGSAKMVDETVCHRVLSQFVPALTATTKTPLTNGGESVYGVQLETREGKQMRRVPIAVPQPLRELVAGLLVELN